MSELELATRSRQTIPDPHALAKRVDHLEVQVAVPTEQSELVGPGGADLDPPAEQKVDEGARGSEVPPRDADVGAGDDGEDDRHS